MTQWLLAMVTTAVIAHLIRIVLSSDEDRVRAGGWCGVLIWANWVLIDGLLAGAQN